MSSRSGHDNCAVYRLSIVCKPCIVAKRYVAKNWPC